MAVSAKLLQHAQVVLSNWFLASVLFIRCDKKVDSIFDRIRYEQCEHFASLPNSTTDCAFKELLRLMLHTFIARGKKRFHFDIYFEQKILGLKRVAY